MLKYLTNEFKFKIQQCKIFDYYSQLCIKNVITRSFLGINSAEQCWTNIIIAKQKGRIKIINSIFIEFIELLCANPDLSAQLGCIIVTDNIQILIFNWTNCNRLIALCQNFLCFRYKKIIMAFWRTGKGSSLCFRYYKIIATWDLGVIETSGRFSKGKGLCFRYIEAILIPSCVCRYRRWFWND